MKIYFAYDTHVIDQKSPFCGASFEAKHNGASSTQSRTLSLLLLNATLFSNRHSCHISPINCIARPSDISTLVTQKKRNQFRNFLRLTNPLQGDLRISNMCHQLGNRRLTYWGVNGAWGNTIDPNVSGALFERCGLCEANDGMLFSICQPAICLWSFCSDHEA